MSTHRPRSRYIPSTKTTRCASSTTSGMGQTFQNRSDRRLKVRPSPGMDLCVSLERSHPRKALKSARSES